MTAAARGRQAGAATPAAKKRPRARKPDPARTWARSLARRRPGLVEFVLHELAALYGTPRRDTRLDPVSELVLTILSQNTADVNSERAFQALRDAYPTTGPVTVHRVVTPDGTEAPPEGWGGCGLDPGSAPDWDAVERAPLDELMEVIRPGGLAPQKAPRIQDALRHIREATGGTGHDLGFLATMEPRAARDWLTQVPGSGRRRPRSSSSSASACRSCRSTPTWTGSAGGSAWSRRRPAPTSSTRSTAPPRARAGPRRPRPPDPARPEDLRRPPSRLRPLPDRPPLPLPGLEGAVEGA